MTNSVYTTRPEAIDREIIPALGGFEEDFDIESIADEVLDCDKDGYWVKASVEEFYEIAAMHDKTA